MFCYIPILTSGLDFKTLPTQTIGTCGLTKPQAVAKYGQDNIKVYTSKFANLFYGIFDMEPDQKSKTMMKVICTGLGLDEKVIGIHMLGMGCSEELNCQVPK